MREPERSDERADDGTPPESISAAGVDEVADQVARFLAALQTVAREGEAGQGVPLMLLEVSEVLLAGARLAVREDFTPASEFQPDAGPDPDLDVIRDQLATMLGDADVYGEVFDPYDPDEPVPTRLSDDLASVAAALSHGLRHHRDGRVREALWWWQYSYVASWGSEASAALRALQSIVAHDRLDSRLDPDGPATAVEAGQLAAADEMLASSVSRAP